MCDIWKTRWHCQQTIDLHSQDTHARNNENTDIHIMVLFLLRMPENWLFFVKTLQMTIGKKEILCEKKRN